MTITKTHMRGAYQDALTLMRTPGAFGRSLRNEFHAAREYRDDADVAADLLKVLQRQLFAHESRNAHDIRQDAIRLAALAEGVNALACLMCNGVMRPDAKLGRDFASWNDDDARDEENTRTTLVQAMNATLAFYRARVVSSYGDPRGHVVHIQFEDGSSNRGGSEKVYGL